MACSRIGISRKTAISPASRSTSGITLPTVIETAEADTSLSAPARRSSSAQRELMPSLFGETSSMIAGKTESTAPSSETKVRLSRPSLSDRLTPSLILSGLIAGTTPSSIRKVSGATILDFASSKLAGSDAERQKAACSFSNAALRAAEQVEK